MENATDTISAESVEMALRTVSELCRRYQITALEDMLESCQGFACEQVLNIAIVGRFNAGKSSFLNHLLGGPVLPVGVIPVTSVVTEIEFGSEPRAEVRFLDGRSEPIAPERIGEFVSEANNPENGKRAAAVRVETPSMNRYRGIRFVDTPGLESVLRHNTDASMGWLPNVGMALVAVSADPPLSQHDIELIRELNRYTPNISLLLTKVDVLEADELAQVETFVNQQLARYWQGTVPVFQYSVRPGFEHLRTQLHESFLLRVHREIEEQRTVILLHKVDSLLGECKDYLNVALKAAMYAESEREQLRQTILGQRESLDDTRLALRLIVRHAIGGTRTAFEDLLGKHERAIRERLLAGLDKEFAAWVRSLSMAMDRFEEWMGARIAEEMLALSQQHREDFVDPVRRVSRQLSQCLQDFRNRLSERTLQALGVPLRTTQMDLRIEDPRSPDVRVGKIFDHNWELLSWVAPMALLKNAVKKHLARKVTDVVVMNLSRLASQWEGIANLSLYVLERDSTGSLDSLIVTIERLVESAGQEAPGIQADLDSIEFLRRRLLRVR